MGFERGIIEAAELRTEYQQNLRICKIIQAAVVQCLNTGLSCKNIILSVKLEVITRFVKARAWSVSRFVKDNRTVTLQQVAAYLNQGSSQKIFEYTIRLTMHCISSNIIPLVSVANWIKHFELAQKNWLS
ncbi:hypothetical protein CDAR_230421 [Caerostris darwini]|uniref:Uncharacterized protein n=1 Tax=Caerostris darwini TaxID=1538125 RepID=A0AAV4WBR5_9ARAC|nr:hypothetical protein CDAR_230421 [Caerostris darwini]